MCVGNHLGQLRKLHCDFKIHPRQSVLTILHRSGHYRGDCLEQIVLRFFRSKKPQIEPQGIFNQLGTVLGRAVLDIGICQCDQFRIHADGKLGFIRIPAHEALLSACSAEATLFFPRNPARILYQPPQFLQCDFWGAKENPRTALQGGVNWARGL